MASHLSSERCRPFWVSFLLAVSACAQSQTSGAGGTSPGADSAAPTDATSADGAVVDSSGGNTCVACVTDNDCPTGSACGQFGGDTYCAPTCTTASSCPAGRSCATISGYDGLEDTVCLPTTGPCAVPIIGDAGTSNDASSTVESGVSDSGSTTCGSLVGPTVTAACNGCGTHTCQPDGCYGGWWCDTSTSRCQAPPATGSCAGGGTGADAGTATDSGVVVVDSGPPPTGSVNASGGSVSRLFFAVVGDTRPATEDDTGGYPTTVIGPVFKQVAALAPQFVVSTGDYMFATPAKKTASAQLALYMTARNQYTGVQFAAMGNHECTGATASNCGTGNTDGITDNYTQFLSTMLAPIGQTKPYYSVNINATDGGWTSKLVFIAGNAWDSGQSTWLDSTLAKATTYTFIVRHEPAEANTAPGVTPSEAIIAKYPYTVKIVGHTHTYEHYLQQEVLVGNGGAPLTSTSTALTYGYATFEQQADGTIAIDMHDYQTGATDPAFHFSVMADGSKP